MLQIAGELHNHKVLDQLHRHFKAWNIKEFYATAEKVLRVESGNQVVNTVIVDDQLISEKDQESRQSLTTFKRSMEEMVKWLTLTQT